MFWNGIGFYPQSKTDPKCIFARGGQRRDMISDGRIRMTSCQHGEWARKWMARGQAKRDKCLGCFIHGSSSKCRREDYPRDPS